VAVRRKSGSDPEYFDKLEVRPAKAREAALMSALPKLIAHAKKRAPGWARILKDVNPARIASRKALASLPVTRKSDLSALQKETPPLGGLNATPVEKLAKLFVSPGPIYDPEGRGKDWWRTARGLFAGGFRPGDRRAPPRKPVPCPRSPGFRPAGPGPAPADRTGARRGSPSCAR